MWQVDYLNIQLKNAFNELAPGTRIVSTKEFCPVDFKINDRNAGKDIGSIMRVKGTPQIILLDFLR